MNHPPPTMTEPQNTPCFCSWSGGKDSCLALYRAIETGMQCEALFTMLIEDGSLSRSHGQSVEAIRAQAEAMGLPLRTAQASWADYEAVFKQTGRALVREGIRDGVFGDIDLETHREWIERVCGEVGIRPHLPLWKSDRVAAVGAFLESGFTAVVVAVNTARLSRDYLGRELNAALLAGLAEQRVDLCGEEGEYHTFVTGGPLFSRPLGWTPGPVQEHRGYAFVQLEVHE
jgi:uncharacterized protein (TIGR00290 family)